jgi:hypothetical protein
MYKLFLNVALLLSASTASADPAGELLEKLASLDKVQFQKYDGYLFQSWLQFDENDLSYVVYIGNRKYNVKLDDGRGTSERAKDCRKENLFDENPVTGCAISFDGQYTVDDKSGSVEVSTIIWNVNFK